MLTKSAMKSAPCLACNPPNTPTCSRRVSLESRYGTCAAPASVNALITLPSADRDRLILVASFSRSPVAPVLACRSLPARSTKFSLPTRMPLPLLPPLLLPFAGAAAPSLEGLVLPGRPLPGRPLAGRMPLPLPPLPPLPLLPLAAPLPSVSTTIVKMEWEREESWFMSVAPTERFFLPTCRDSQVGEGVGVARCRAYLTSVYA